MTVDPGNKIGRLWKIFWKREIFNPLDAFNEAYEDGKGITEKSR